MRELMRPFTGANRLNYLCILTTELLGAGSMRDIPTFLSGYNSVLNTLDPAVAQAIRTLRVCGFAPTTARELRLLVDAYIRHHRARGEGVETEESDLMAQLFEVDTDFNVRPMWTTTPPASIVEALNFLIVEPPVRVSALAPLHDEKMLASVRSQISS